jgi:flagellar motility protein MotE (MotC chaperone)
MAAMHRPRLLPATIVVMALLLLVKSVSLVWAATGSATGAGSGSAARGAAGPALPAGKAQAPDVKTPAVTDAAAPPSAGRLSAVPPSGAAPEAMAPPVSDAERSLLLDLRHRREALDARDKALDQRSIVLSAAQARLSARVDELGALQARLEHLDADRRAHDEANWSGLVHVYETMKPREAAAIFDALDMQVLLAVLDRMQPRRAAPVLAAMQPDRARLATQMLAEMRTRSVTPASIPAAAPKG